MVICKKKMKMDRQQKHLCFGLKLNFPRSVSEKVNPFWLWFVTSKKCKHLQQLHFPCRLAQIMRRVLNNKARKDKTIRQNWTLNRELKSFFISIFCHIFRSNVISSARDGISFSHGPGSRVKKDKIIHGGTSDFWTDITEYFKNPKFQNRAIWRILRKIGLRFSFWFGSGTSGAQNKNPRPLLIQIYPD